jgi:hypothetical protein
MARTFESREGRGTIVRDSLTAARRPRGMTSHAFPSDNAPARPSTPEVSSSRTQTWPSWILRFAMS